MLRVLRQAEDLGIEGWSSPTTTSPDDLSANLKYKSYIHELGAMGLYIFLTEDPHDGAPGRGRRVGRPAADPVALRRGAVAGPLRGCGARATPAASVGTGITRVFRFIRAFPAADRILTPWLGRFDTVYSGRS